MTNNVLCEEFAERLADLLERDVDETTRAALESHALSCAECGSLLADVRKLRIDASSLPELTPSRDLWAGVAERIDAPVIPLRAGERAAPQRTRWPRWGSMAAAAVLLIAVTSTSTYFLTIHSSIDSTRVAVAPHPATGSTPLSNGGGERTVPIVATAPDSNAATTVATEPKPTGTRARLVSSRPSAEQVYSSEIARLRTIVERRRTQLDPVTISVIERNLKVIDDAITQCRLALSKDPASRFLMESLNNALETKVELLRTATMLPARS